MLEPQPRTVSVVICAYADERQDRLRRAVASVERQSRPADEVIVVIDHNPRLMQALAAGLPAVRVIPNAGQRGLRDARNSGVQAAFGDLVAFMDDDAEADRGWLSELDRAFEDPQVIAAGGMVSPDWEGRPPAWFPAEFNWVVGCTYQGMPTRSQPVRNVHGCNMSFRAEAFRTAGMFRLGYSCDETEFCIRAARTNPGSVVLFVPAARVRHWVPRRRATWRYLLSRCYFEGGSKAVLVWLCGREAGLADERSHLLRTLPQAVAESVRDAVRTHDPAVVGRIAAIGLGAGSAALGYLIARPRIRSVAADRGYAVEPGP